MKKIYVLIMLAGFSFCVLSAQTAKIAKNPVGRWIFEAPYAPYGYNTGTSDIGFKDMTYTVSMTFTEMGYSFTGENVKARNDSLFFDMWIEGTPINIVLSVEQDTLIKGVSNYFEGTVPFTMKRVATKED